MSQSTEDERHQQPAASPIVLPTHDDPVIASGSTGIGGPVGRMAAIGATWWTPLRVLIVLATLGYILGYVLDLSCRSTGWMSPERYEHLCYSDIPPLYSLRGFADGLIPYLQIPSDGVPLEYPVLTGVFMLLAAGFTGLLMRVPGFENAATTFFDVNVIGLWLALLVAVVATALTVRRRPWDAAMVALAPTVIMAATINWDLLPLAFAGVSLALWARQRPLAAGIFLGLAIAAKFYPLFFLIGFGLLTLRSGRWKAFLLLIAGTIGSWLVVNGPVALLAWDGWSYFYRFSRERGEDFGSIWFAISQAGLTGVPPDALNAVATGTLVLLLIGISGLVLLAPRRPRLAQVLFLLIAAFVLTNKVYSPQYVLWLVPLAALARPRWRDFLIWQAGELVYFAAIWWFLVGYGMEDTKGLTPQWYAAAILVHVLATGYFAIMVIRDILEPAHDPVRNDGFTEDIDDPGGGAFDRSADVLGPLSFGGRRRRTDDEQAISPGRAPDRSAMS